MAHSIEILMDPDTEAAVRAEWTVLDDLVGRPSRPAAHRPHCTLVAGSAITPRLDRLTGRIATTMLPIPLRLGPPVILGGGRRVTLTRSVLPSRALIALHHAVHDAYVDGVTDASPHCAPDRWTPHVTLLRRLSPTEIRRLSPTGVPAALERLGAPPDESSANRDGRAMALRRWDGDAKTDIVFHARDTVTGVSHDTVTGVSRDTVTMDGKDLR
ncbi:2'-5' RNA ligase family protein [Gordonia shandongensis]|uniref:2'-5' RNA ligase family protein n=1 Tax=Gordonia shandongensis TaxID=376351 RepID=UPI0004173AD1|nr:2'-5' RNA ligase family protein [Gordonia shandongensis]